MKNVQTYTDIYGDSLSLHALDTEERKLVQDLQKFARRAEWSAFSNYWIPAVAALYEKRGLKPRQMQQTLVWRIAQDLDGRLAVAEGHARIPDYRDELEWLIRDKFPSRRAFCKATGLSEDMLSHVLARRKHLAIDTLIEALNSIGYDLRIRPLPKGKAS